MSVGLMNRPKLVPPCSGWQEDLPRPDEMVTVIPALGFDTPNHQDDIYLELPRAAAVIRGLMIWFAFVIGFMLAEMLWSYLSTDRTLRRGELLEFSTFALVTIWSILIFWKLDVAPPRDMPLRFNRARQRLYAYNFNFRWWDPFERWKVEPVAYDWSQVRVERWFKRGATTHGVVFKGGVVLSIVKPGTNEVIDRFPLTTMGADQHAWAYVCTYMQQGPDALPPPGRPKDHNNVMEHNIALLLAPKVKWPADMDRESRTAS